MQHFSGESMREKKYPKLKKIYEDTKQIFVMGVSSQVRSFLSFILSILLQVKEAKFIM